MAGGALLALGSLTSGPGRAATSAPTRLHVVTDDNYPPYLFRNDEGQVTGYLVDYWALWARKTGVAVTLTGTRWEEAQRRVLAGEADVIDMIYKTPAREPLYAFTAPYAELPVNLYSHRSIAGITGVDALQGFKIGVQAGDACAEELARRGVTAQVLYPNYAELFAGARRHEHLVFCLDQFPAEFYLNKLGLQGEFRKAFTLYTGQFRRATPRARAGLLAVVERGAAAIDPAERRQLADKWFGQAVPAHRRIDYTQLGAVLGIVAAAAALALAWVRLLHRQVAARTHELQRANAELIARGAELLRSQQQLSDSRDQLHLALDAAQAGTWSWDRTTGESRWSDELWRLSGLDRGRWTPGHEAWTAAIDPRDRAAAQSAWRQAVAEGAVFEATWRVADPAGTAVRWLLSRGRPVLDAAGRCSGYNGIVIDISQRKAVENALQRSQARLRTLLDTLPDPVWLKDLDGVYLACNRRFESLFGHAESEILGRTDHDFVPHALAERFRALDREALHSAGPVTREEEVRFASDGHRELLQTVKTPVRDDAGELVGVLGISRDITELRDNARELEAHRQHLEELVGRRTAELAHERRRLQDILAGTDAGTWEWDLRTGALACNEQWARMLGYRPGELGRIDISTWARLVHPEDLQHLAGQLDEHFAARSPLLDTELRMRRADGQWAWVLARGRVSNRAADGRALLMSGTTLDISRSKATELALQRAKEAAEAAGRAKGSFLANMSHEIRTPLNGVLGLAQIGFRDSVGRARAQSTFQRILDSGRLLLAILDDVLDFSKIEAGRLSVDHRPLDPGRVVDETVAGAAVLASDKSIPIVVDKSALPAGVMGDPVRLAQVLHNLLSNAVKFTERGQVQLIAAARGDELVFEVRDTGIGIDAAMLERLFQPFEQADGSITRRFGGTGLGLAISRRLAGLMGGSLEVQSQPGVGSSFTLRLPLQPATLPQPQPGERAVVGARRLQGLHLLVAEDNAVNQLVLDDLLRGEGADVVLAADGREALACVAQSQRAFDAVLMDVQMPLLDGLEAARRLGRSHPGLPVIGQTAHALREEMDRCRDAGMVATVHKPIDLELLVSVLLEVVGARGRAGIGATALQRLHARQPELARRLRALFAEHHAADAERLRVMAQAQDFAGIERLAHELKGAAGGVRAHAVEACSAQTLDRARRRDPGALASAEQLAEALDRALVELRLPEAAGTPG